MKGIVVDEGGVPLEAATLLLIQLPDSSLLKSTITDRTGNFEIPGAPDGKYLLNASSLGFKPKRTFVTINSKFAGAPLTIVLNASRKRLDPIVVTEQNPLLQVFPGKVIVNVEGSILNIGSNAFEIIKRAPTVQIERDEIKLRGRPGVVILIDGKPLYLAYDDLSNFLQNLQSSTIQQIEILSNPDSRYDAAGTGGIIDIKLKKGKALGSDGTVSIGAGYGDNYKSNAGVNYNYRTRKFNFFGTYAYGNNKGWESVRLNRFSTENPEGPVFTISNDDNKIRKSNAYKVGADYFLNPNNTIGIAYTGTYATLSSDERNRSEIRSQRTVDSIVSATSFETRAVYNGSVNLNYIGKLKKIGEEITVDFDFLHYDRDSHETLKYVYSLPSGGAYHDPLDLRNNSPSFFRVWSAKVDYAYPIGKDSKLAAGVKSSFVSSNNDRVFEKSYNDSWLVDPLLSNKFDLTERINASYVNYYYEGSKSSIAVGLRVEQTNTKGMPLSAGQPVNRSFTNFFPSFQWSLPLSKSNKLLLSYNRRIRRPVYEELNPFIYFLDQYTYRVGNPYLRPEYSNNYELGFLNKEKRSLSFTYSFTKDPVYMVNLQQAGSNALVTSKQNFGDYRALGLEFSSPFSFTSKWSGNLSVAGNYDDYTFPDLDDETAHNKTPYLTVNLSNYLLLPNRFRLEGNFSYNGTQANGIYRQQAVPALDLGIMKSVLKKKANIKVSAMDVFNARKTNYSTTYRNLNLKAIEKVESRMVRINFIYNFGKGISSNSINRKAGNDEENRRIRN